MPKGLVFAGQFLKRARQLGTPFESSKTLVNRVVKEIRGKDIIELGAGTGPVTRGILQYQKDVQVSAFENNPALLSELYKIRDSRLTVIPESAGKISEYFPDLRGKCVVSGLPFSSMNKEVVDSILSQCRDAERFVAYKYFSMDELIGTYFGSVKKRRVIGFPLAVIYVATNRSN